MKKLSNNRSYKILELLCKKANGLLYCKLKLVKCYDWDASSNDLNVIADCVFSDGKECSRKLLSRFPGNKFAARPFRVQCIHSFLPSWTKALRRMEKETKLGKTLFLFLHSPIVSPGWCIEQAIVETDIDI